MEELPKHNYILHTLPTQFLNKRFMIKVSTFQMPEKELSVLIVVFDVLEGSVMSKHFTNEAAACAFLNLFKAVK